MTQLFKLILTFPLFLLTSCDNDAFQKDATSETRLYVQNDLDGFFRLISPLTIRKMELLVGVQTYL